MFMIQAGVYVAHILINKHDVVAEDGVLSLFNITKETSGFFICLSKNDIGSASCNFTLAVMPRKYFKTFQANNLCECQIRFHHVLE